MSGRNDVNAGRRELRLDGKPRNRWALWNAEQARRDGKPEDVAFWERRADEVSHAERRAQRAAATRTFAQKWRAAGGAEAYALRLDAEAAALERPEAFAWPDGHDRASAERAALATFPSMPVADAPDVVLRAILEHHLEKLAQMAAAVAPQPKPAPTPTDDEKDERTDALGPWASPHASIATFDPIRDGVGAFASPPPGTRKRRKGGR